MDPKTIAIHGEGKVHLLGGAITPPIQLSTTFDREGDGSYPLGFSYSRRNNPNRDALEEALAAFEGGFEAACFASGTAATMAVMQALATGDHVLVPEDSYYGSRAMLREIFPRWGLQCDLVDMADEIAVERALKPNTKLIWVETPSNPMMRITNLRNIALLARQIGAVSVADNTVATALLQRPFEFGFDLIVHSTTKYINGHSDVLGGVVIAREKTNPYMERIRQIQIHGGAVPSPFDCWLTLRGLRTLPYRVPAQSAAAAQIAAFLSSHPRVEKVYYAGLPSHPGHVLARQQMQSYGGLLSFTVPGGQKDALAVAAACRLIRRATSLGGVESLIEQRSSMEGPETTTPPNLLRLSVGLEAVSDLTQDLNQALGMACQL